MIDITIHLDYLWIAQSTGLPDKKVMGRVTKPQIEFLPSFGSLRNKIWKSRNTSSLLDHNRIHNLKKSMYTK